MSEPFITPPDLQVYLSIPANNLDDALGALAIDKACDVVRKEVGYELTAETKTLLLTGAGTSFLTLPLPLVEATTITVYEPDGTNVTEDVVVHRDGDWHQLEWPDNVFLQTENGVRVEGSWGYVDPPPIAQIVALQVAARIYELGISTSDNVGGVAAQSIAGAGSLNELEEKALYPLKRLM